MKKTIETLQTRKEILSKIANSQFPIDSKLIDAHKNRIFNAKLYINEIEGLLGSLTPDAKFYIVPINTFEKKVESADFATIEDEGFFFKLAHIINYPGEEMTLLYLAPLSNV